MWGHIDKSQIFHLTRIKEDNGGDVFAIVEDME